MNQTKKGFTLVELLAVIVILAIIAVIAVPQVLKIVETSRQDAFLASVRSALKVAEQEAAKGNYKTTETNYLSNLSLDNNPFKETNQGYWHYDSINKTVVIPVASSSNQKYQVNEISSKKVDGYTLMSEAKVVNKEDPNLLANVIRANITLNCVEYTGQSPYDPSACIVTTSESGDSNVIGYIRGPLTGAGVNNYVQFVGTDWRIVKINNNGTILMVRDDVISTSSGKAYDGSYPICYGSGSWTGVCSNNFAKANIKTYLNNEYYPDAFTSAAFKDMLVSNNWDTRCTNGTTYVACSDNVPITTVSKVGLLTHYDYVVGTRTTMSSSIATGKNSYLNKSSFFGPNIKYWSGTGSNNLEHAWFMSGNGNISNSFMDGELYFQNKVRPAIVLKAGTLLDCTIGSGAGQCNGSSTNPYKIK